VAFLHLALAVVMLDLYEQMLLTFTSFKFSLWII